MSAEASRRFDLVGAEPAGERDAVLQAELGEALPGRLEFAVAGDDGGPAFEVAQAGEGFDSRIGAPLRGPISPRKTILTVPGVRADGQARAAAGVGEDLHPGGDVGDVGGEELLPDLAEDEDAAGALEHGADLGAAEAAGGLEELAEARAVQVDDVGDAEQAGDAAQHDFAERAAARGEVDVQQVEPAEQAGPGEAGDGGGEVERGQGDVAGAAGGGEGDLDRAERHAGELGADCVHDAVDAALAALAQRGCDQDADHACGSSSRVGA